MQRNNVFFNPVDLEAGLYTMKILCISPRIGSSKIDLCMKILTFPLTKQNIDYSDRILLTFLIDEERVIGVVHFKIPVMGYVVRFVQLRWYFIVPIIALIFVFFKLMGIYLAPSKKKAAEETESENGENSLPEPEVKMDPEKEETPEQADEPEAADGNAEDKADDSSKK